MNVDGFLNFNTNINTKGFTKGISGIKEKLGGVKSSLLKFGTTVAAVFSVKAIVNFSKECKSLYEIQLEAETKLETVLGRNLGATEEQIKATKEWASELQNVGVIGDEVQLSGLQELSTYIENPESLKKMNVVLNDMLAQQYGLNATAESAVTISTMLGKVLEGQTAALSRYGYSFDESQEYLLKYGTEEQRVATLAEVVESSVGGMNEALAKTPAGRLKQVSNSLGDVKEQFGQAFINIEAIFLPVLVKLTDILAETAELAVKVSQSLADIFGIQTSNASAVTSDIAESTDEQNALTEAVEETAEAQENSLAGFDQINTLTQKTEKSSETSENKSEEISIKPVVVTDSSETEKKIDEFSEKIQKLIEPIQLAWEANSPELIENVRTAFENIRELAGSVAESFEEVWTNGSGERYIGNIITLFADVFGIIGDISGTLQNAWEDNGRGTALIQSYFDRWNSLLELLHAINKAFREVWNDGTGEKICANIFEIITNINNTVSNLRQRFIEAWEENGTGVRIFRAVLGIINIILKTINSLTKKTSEWAKNLNFSPVLKSVAGLFESLEPLAENICDVLSGIYEEILLPIGSWVIEEAVPASIDLFSKAIDVLNSIIEALKPLGKWLYDKFLKPIGEWTGGLVVSIIEGLTDALKSISDWISEHQTLFQDFIILIGSLGTALAISGIITKTVNALTAMGGIIKIITTATGGLSGVLAFLTSPVTLVCLAIGGIIAIGVLLVKHWDEVKAFAVGIWESIQETLYSFFEAWETGWNAITDFTSAVWDSITNFFAEAWTTITGIFQNIGGWFSDRCNDIADALSNVSKWFENMFKKAYTKVTDIFKSIGKWFSDRWNDITSALSEVGNWFRNKFRNAWDNITQIFKNIGGWFSDRWGDIVNVFSVVDTWFSQKFRQARDNVTEIFSNIGNWFSERWDNITSVFSAVGDWFSEKFQNAWGGIKTAFSEVNEFFGGVWNGITSVFSHVTEWFRNTFSSAWEAVRNVFSRGGEIFTGITDGIFNTFRTIVNGLINGINWVISQPFNAINWALNGIRNIEILDWYPFQWLPSISVPQIPYLAQGTVVPANYGNFLAVLGDNKREAEVVSPLSTIEQAVTNAMKKNGGFGSGEIHVHVDLDGREIGRVAVRAVNQDRVRRGG